MIQLIDSVFSPLMSGTSKKGIKSAKSQPQRPTPAKGAKPANFAQRNKLYIILFALVFAVYGNSIFNGYALDDEFYTNNGNQLTQQGFKGIPEIFTSRTFYNNDGTGYSFRPVAVASFAIEIQLFGEKPRVSHFINVLLYALTVVLLFGLLRKWFRTQGDWFPFIITLLFLVHPIHTEVVANIKCRDELLAFLFAVITFRLVWSFIETNKWWTLALSGITFGLAALSKTSVAPVFFLLPFSVWYFTDKKWWSGLIYIVPMVVVILIIKFSLTARLPEMTRVLQGFENPIKDMSGGQLTATAAYVLGRYFWLMFIPHPLIFYYGLNEVPICSWSDPLVIISAVLYVALGIWTLFEIRKKTIAGFGMTWFFANIVLFSNLFGAAPGLMAERFAYSASLGLIIAAVDVLFRLMKINAASFDWKNRTYKNIRTVVLVVAVLFSLRSVIRNEAWEDKETLYRNDVELAPESAKINMLLGSLLSAQAAELNFKSQQHFSYAQQLAARGMQADAARHQDTASAQRAEAYALFGESREYYKQATTIFPTYYTAWSNLGTSYYFTREYSNGIPYFKKAIAIKQDYAEAYFNLGMSYEQMAMTKGEITDSMFLDSSVYYFEEGLRQDPKYVNSAEQLSRIYFKHYHDSVGAIDLLKKSAADNPKSALPWNAMSNIYLQSKDTAQAVIMLEKAAALDPENTNRLRNLASYFANHNNPEKAAYYSSLFQQKEAEQRKKMKRLGKGK